MNKPTFTLTQDFLGEHLTVYGNYDEVVRLSSLCYYAGYIVCDVVKDKKRPSMGAVLVHLRPNPDFELLDVSTLF